MSKLLSEQELKGAVNSAINHAISAYSHLAASKTRLEVEDNTRIAMTAQDLVIDLIQSQKIAHADMVIGEDALTSGHERSYGKVPISLKETYYSQLRAEQRERNK